MEGNESHVAALVETTVFLQSFKDMPDRRQQGKVNYPLAEILLLCLLAVLAGAETFTEIARFGEKKLALLRRFRPYENGTPSHDHLGDIFATLDAKAFQRCFVAWVAAMTNTPAEVVAIDGKTSRRSYQKKGSKEPIHMVSAFAARQRLAIGPMIRSHWAIENSLHWVMDMVFRDDECRVRTENAPANFTTLKHMAHNLTRRAPGKDSLRLRRKTASWDDDYLAGLVAA